MSRPTAPLSPSFRMVVQSAQETGRIHLCDIDEAELRAVGWRSAGRGARPDWAGDTYDPDRPEIRAAADRLVARGLAWRQDGGGLAAVTILRDYLGVVTGTSARAVTLVEWDEPAAAVVAQPLRRIVVLRGLLGPATAVVEVTDVPVPDAAGPLTVRIDVHRIDALVEDLAARAFAVPPGLTRTSALRVGLERHTVVSAGTGAVLTAPHRGLLRRAERSAPIGRCGYADHLAQLLR